MDDFTEEDPGRGDPGALDELIWRMRRDQTDLEKAHAIVRRSADTVRDHWKGNAGEAAAATHDALLDNIVAKFQVVDSAISVCHSYQLVHSEVKEQAAAWVTQLAHARQALGMANATIRDRKNAPGAEDVIALATRSKTAALEEEAEALSHLRSLHESRVDAQSAFRMSIAELTGSRVSANAVVDKRRPNSASRRSTQGPNDQELAALRERIKRANETVWDMVEAWISGKGKRTFRFYDDDAFTEVFKRSASVARAEAAIREKIFKERDFKDGGRYDARAEDLPRDLSTIASLGNEGNLPEAFIGSFEYAYEVVKRNADGTVIAKITATNRTTADSATRIPKTGDLPYGPYHLPPYDKMKHLEETKGMYAPITQVITWTQTFKGL